LVGEFIKNKAITRQYHTYFHWDSRNANAFFGLFGESFKVFMKQKVDDDPNLDSAIKAFMSIGLERNRLVHQDFGNFVLEKTAADIYEQYRIALKFVEAVPKCIEEFCNR